MDWIAAALIWIGNIILIKKKHWVCFIFFMGSNLLWSLYWLPKQEWAAFILCASFLAQNVWGLITWSRQRSLKQELSLYLKKRTLAVGYKRDYDRAILDVENFLADWEE